MLAAARRRRHEHILPSQPLGGTNPETPWSHLEPPEPGENNFLLLDPVVTRALCPAWLLLLPRVPSRPALGWNVGHWKLMDGRACSDGRAHGSGTALLVSSSELLHPWFPCQGWLCTPAPRPHPQVLQAILLHPSQGSDAPPLQVWERTALKAWNLDVSPTFSEPNRTQT